MASVCQVCLSSGLRMISSSKIEVQHVEIFEKLTSFKLSTECCEALCFICFAKLQACSSFSKMALKSAHILKDLRREGLEATQDTLVKLKLAPSPRLAACTARSMYMLGIRHSLDPRDIKQEDNTNEQTTHNHNDEHIVISRTVQPDDPSVKVLYIKSELPDRSDDSSDEELIKVKSENRDVTNVTEETPTAGKAKAAQTQPKRYPCEVCSVSFSRKYGLQVHNRVHTGEKPFSCDRCTKTFKYKGNLTQHKQTHEAELHSCNHCSETFTLFMELRQHVARVHGEETASDQLKLIQTKLPHACTKCDKRFCSKKLLQGHLRIHGEKTHTCPQCHKAFPMRIRLAKHMLTHTGEKPHTCDRCAASFTTRSSLRQHMRVHAGVRPYCCSDCPKTFARKYELTLHLRVHTGEKPFACALCDKRFSQRSTLAVHEKTHSTEKPFSCDICDKTFGDKYTMRRHIALHGGSAPMVCPVCDVTCVTLSALYAHRRRHHRPAAAPLPPPCHICHKTFTCNGHLNRHIKNVHAKVKPRVTK